MRTILLAGCLLAAPVAAQIEDIRGLTFDAAVSVYIDGTVLDQHLNLHAALAPLAVQPHTFDVLPDPQAPKDPSRIILRTRLPVGPEDPDPPRFELAGTWDAGTGAIDVAGSAPGVHFWQTPFEDDAFGLLDAPAALWLQVRDPDLALHALVVATPADGALPALHVAGGPAVPPGTFAAALDIFGAQVAWLPIGAGDDPAQALLGPYLLHEANAALPEVQADVLEVFGDMNDDLLLTQADVIAIMKMLGPTDAGDFEGDLVADGVVDMLDAAYLQWLVRAIGDQGVYAGPPLDGQPQTTGDKPLKPKP